MTLRNFGEFFVY